MRERKNEFSCCEDQVRRPTKSVQGSPWHIIHVQSLFTIKNVYYYYHSYYQDLFKALRFSTLFLTALS